MPLLAMLATVKCQRTCDVFSAVRVDVRNERRERWTTIGTRSGMDDIRTYN